MVKHFSVNWMAQSHHDTTTEEDRVRVDIMPTHAPHVPCMVQPRPPTLYERGYLQPKPKTQKPCTERTEPTEKSSQQELSFSSPLRATNCSSPISEISGYSSGYDSEAASSECLSVDEAEKDSVTQRRVRTKFTPEQIHRLEMIFSQHKYLDAAERVKTAQKLGLSETQVRTWFQNRRMKLKREVQDLRAESLLTPPTVSPMIFQHMAPIQYQAYGGQRLQYPAPSQAFYPNMIPQFPVHQPMIPHQSPHLMIPDPRFY